jgi:hypothetical protein
MQKRDRERLEKQTVRRFGEIVDLDAFIETIEMFGECGGQDDGPEVVEVIACYEQAKRTRNDVAANRKNTAKVAWHEKGNYSWRLFKNMQEATVWAEQQTFKPDYIGPASWSEHKLYKQGVR